MSSNGRLSSSQKILEDALLITMALASPNEVHPPHLPTWMSLVMTIVTMVTS